MRIPLVGDAVAFGRDPLGCLARLAAVEGDVALLRLGSHRIWLLGRADLAVDVLAGRPDAFVKSSLLTRRGRPLFGQALTVLDGDAWATRRRALQPGFDAAFFRRAAATSERLAHAAVGALAADTTHDLRALAGEWCLHLALAAIVGDEDRAAAARLAVAGEAAIAAFGARMKALVPFGHGRRMASAMDVVRRHIAGAVHARRLAPKGDALSAILAGGAPPDDAALVDDLAVDVAVGAHQAAILMTWALVEAARVPGLLARIGRREIDGVVAETLRLHPPFYLLMRQTVAPERFDGHEVPAGAHLAVSPYLLHRDARYHAAPERFDVERFASGRRVPGSYLPFGLGARGCPGRQLAVSIVTVLLTALVERFEVTIDAKDVRERPSVALDVGGRVGLRATSPSSDRSAA